MTNPRICTIEARMNSSRLPGKVLLDFNGMSMLEIMVSRIKRVSEIGQIVIATTINSIDDPIVLEAKRLGIQHYRGSENDVQSRVLNAALQFGANELVALTGDCPLIDPELIELCVSTFAANDVDYLSNAGVRSYPDGMDTQVLTTSALQRSFKMNPSDEEREHVTLHIRRNPKEFRCMYLVSPLRTRVPKLGLTLDEEADFKLIKAILSGFKGRLDFSCAEILEYIERHPDILALNSAVKRKEVT
jgi:spore coat polysaccharide biosynthesis protein SpsF